MTDTVAAGSRARVGQLNLHPPYIVDYSATTSNSSAFTTTETALITSNSVTLKNGRAYRFDILMIMTHATTSATGLVRVRIRRNSTSGNQIRTVGAFAVVNGTTATINQYIAVPFIATNTTGSDITDTFVVTGVRESGTSVTFTMSGSSSNPSTLAIWDIGPASDFTGAASIT